MYHSRLAQRIAIRGAVCQNHLMEPEPHSHSCALRWFVLEDLGQEECHVTLKMLRLTSTLLKEPFNRTIDVSLL